LADYRDSTRPDIEGAGVEPAAGRAVPTNTTAVSSNGIAGESLTVTRGVNLSDYGVNTAEAQDLQQRNALQSDVMSAIEQFAAESGRRIIGLREITTLPVPGKSVFRVSMSDEAKLKLSFCNKFNAQDIERRIESLDAIPSTKATRVLLYGEGWSLSEWVAGTPLSECDISAEIIEQAARLLNEFHRAPVTIADSQREAVLEGVTNRLSHYMGILQEAGLLSALESDWIFSLFDEVSRSELRMSLVHGDFSPANLVLSPTGVFSIDNEHIDLHVADYDLCRAVNLWQENNGLGNQLHAAYESCSSTQMSASSHLFWMLYDLVYEIGWRRKQFKKRSEFGIDRLQLLLQEQNTFATAQLFQAG
jgi:thiamine kinase-like enzyme